jgi:Ser/Thr protein kinase RdoA (MazF antagonist)
VISPEQYRELQEHFGLEADVQRMQGGEGRTFRSGSSVFRLENAEDWIEALNEVATLCSRIIERDFRVSRPKKTKTGQWITPGRWSAWTWVEGVSATENDLASVVFAVRAFHNSMAYFSKPESLQHRNSLYDRADRAAWDEAPLEVHPLLQRYYDRLMALKKPVIGMQDQLIHGDLNPQNILVAPRLAPAIIDAALYWRPHEFAMAVLAYWMGAYRGRAHVLNQFASVKNFDQMLVRAALRTLLISSEFGRNGRNLEGFTNEFETPVSCIEQWFADRGNRLG